MHENPRDLMQRAKAGDKQAFAKIYELYLTPVYRYIFLRVRDSALAEDLAQTVFLKAYTGLENFQPKEHPPLGYFFTIARNTVIDYSRRKNPVWVDDDSIFLEIADGSPEPAEQLLDNEVQESILEIIGTLKDDQHDVIVLKFLNDLNNPEIAEILGKSQDAIRQIQSRAIKILRLRFKEKYGK